MVFGMDPYNYNIYFSIASLLIVLVAFVINASEEAYDNRQKQIFGFIIADAVLLNCAGLFHSVWMNVNVIHLAFSSDFNNTILVVEKLCAYTMAYLSMLYMLSIYRIEIDKFWKKAILFLPQLYMLIFFVSGFVSDFFYYIDEIGNLHYRYPQGISVGIGLWIYFPFAVYLFYKYARGMSTEKQVSIAVYFFLMLISVPLRFLTRSTSLFEFAVSLSILLCVYTFQNPSEFVDSLSGAGTRNALDFIVGNNLIQKKMFTVFGVYIERLNAITGGQSLEAVSELLNQITAYLKQMSQDGHIFFTDDGSFLLVFPGVDPDDQLIEKAAEQIRKRFKESWIINDEEVRLVQHPYVIGFPDEIDTLDKFNEVRGVINKAILRHNKDVLRVSDLNLKHVEHDKKIDSIVKRALDDGLLEVYYQPIYNPEKGKFVSCEALLRLRDPHLGFISPAVFMPVAERNGKVIDIDAFVLDSVCKMISESDATAHGLEYVEVNLSVVDCIQANLADNILKTMNKYGIDPDQVNFEITETYSEDISSAMDANIEKLSAQGINFSMDDFGTGYSNMARVASLPVKIFKLDKSIVQSAFESETSYMVMINIVKIIKSLGKEIVAEGVETEEQAKQIIRVGCDNIQGFFYARPMPMSQFLEFLRGNNH
jgi:EAL domain-containing protein (putative c-di-GMP-specific phosphodiesterase class I)